MNLISEFNVLSFKQKLWEYLPQLRLKRIGILDGPLSEEDRIYNITARPSDLEIPAIKNSFDNLRLSYDIIDPTQDGWLEKIISCDPIFINVHGEFGEDGRFQSLLDILGKHYIGSDAETSAIGMSKPLFKNIVSNLGFSTPRFFWSQWENTPLVTKVEDMTFPVMAKPVYGGCSMGIEKLQTLQEYKQFEMQPVNRSTNYFYEEFIEGRFLTVSVLEADGQVLALPPLEVITKGGFYDETAKKDPDEVQLAVYTYPSDEFCKESGLLRKTASDIFKAVAARNYARLDFIVSPDNKFWLLEINTVPGVSSAGNFPASAAQIGLTYDEVTIALLKAALESDIVKKKDQRFLNAQFGSPIIV